MSLIQYSHALPGHFYILISLNDEFYCQIRTYFQMVSLSTIYYSNCLQAIHRLCRIVFYKKRSFQSFQLYKSLIIIQWIVCFLLMIPSLLIGDFVYVENDYYCQIDFRNLRNVLVNGALIYGIPANITIACYIYTLTKLTNATNDQHQRMTQIQQMMARRDMLVIFRICILFALLISGSILSILLLFIYIFTGYLPWWSTQSQWFATISTVTIVSVVLTFAFPDVRNLLMQYFRRRNRTRIMPIALQMN